MRRLRGVRATLRVPDYRDVASSPDRALTTRDKVQCAHFEMLVSDDRAITPENALESRAVEPTSTLH